MCLLCLRVSLVDQSIKNLPAVQETICSAECGFEPWVQKVSWRRKWQPTPVFLPGESQGWGSLVGGRLWGLTELDTTEVT